MLPVLGIIVFVIKYGDGIHLSEVYALAAVPVG